MKPRFLLYMLLLAVSCSEISETDKLFAQLDEALEMTDTYDEYFNHRVESVKNMLQTRTSKDQIYDINKELAWEYATYSLDSCISYLRKNLAIAKDLGDSYKQDETNLLLAEEYILAGYHAEAGEILGKYKAGDIHNELKALYFRDLHTLSGEMMAYSQNGDVWWEKRHQRDEYRDSLLARIDPGTFEWLDLKREEADANGNDSLRVQYTKQMVEMSRYNSHDYAKACFWMIFATSDEDEQFQWLAHSAIADRMCATKDYAALMELAKRLFRNRGDINRAFRYVADYCMPDAIRFNGKLRPWQIAKFFPEIERAYEQQTQTHERKMEQMIIVVSALLLLSALLLVSLILRQKALTRTRKELEESYQNLKESDNIKQEYIARFLSELSANINTTRQYKNHVLKYIRRGNTKYLTDEIESEPPIDEDIDKFYKMFDETFVSLYPDFVDQFNTLLTDGEEIVPKGDNILTPELRVFALIKLGITDSSKIAQLLHYSANTIYNYRAKIKNKARGDRDHFEEAVKAIN